MAVLIAGMAVGRFHLGFGDRNFLDSAGDHILLVCFDCRLEGRFSSHDAFNSLDKLKSVCERNIGTLSAIYSC